MFTGIVQTVGTLRACEALGGDCRLHIEPGALDVNAIGLGDSVSVSGVCLTVIAHDAGALAFDVSVETLTHTTLGDLEPGHPVNLETAATPSTALGGHIVSGHVDGIGTVAGRRPDGRSVRFDIDLPSELARYVAPKGSVCIDGISLTVNGVHGRRFDVNIVPHTLDVTTMHSYAPGRRVNVEVDVIARYVERLLDARATEQP